MVCGIKLPLKGLVCRRVYEVQVSVSLGIENVCPAAGYARVLFV